MKVFIFVADSAVISEAWWSRGSVRAVRSPADDCSRESWHHRTLVSSVQFVWKYQCHCGTCHQC